MTQPAQGYLPPDEPPGGGNRTVVMVVIGAVIAAALAVGAYAVVTNRSNSTASTPKDAVRKLLKAGQGGDLAAAKKVLCRSDLAQGVADRLNSGGEIRSYSIGRTSSNGGIRRVAVTTTTTQRSTPATQQIPVVSEGGTWKVCFTEATKPVPTLGGSATGVPTTASSGPTTHGPPTALPSGVPTGPSICASATNNLVAAEIYVDAAQTGLSKYAQTCIYRNRVPLSVTESLNGKVFGPQTTDPNAGEFVFATTGGSTRITVRVAKQSDGHYYVTGVRTG